MTSFGFSLVLISVAVIITIGVSVKSILTIYVNTIVRLSPSSHLENIAYILVMYNIIYINKITINNNCITNIQGSYYNLHILYMHVYMYIIVQSDRVRKFTFFPIVQRILHRSPSTMYHVQTLMGHILEVRELSFSQ